MRYEHAVLVYGGNLLYFWLDILVQIAGPSGSSIGVGVWLGHIHYAGRLLCACKYLLRINPGTYCKLFGDRHKGCWHKPMYIGCFVRWYGKYKIYTLTDIKKNYMKWECGDAEPYVRRRVTPPNRASQEGAIEQTAEAKTLCKQWKRNTKMVVMLQSTRRNIDSRQLAGREI